MLILLKVVIHGRIEGPWNVHDHVQGDLPRTTNTLEGWHPTFAFKWRRQGDTQQSETQLGMRLYF